MPSDPKQQSVPYTPIEPRPRVTEEPEPSGVHADPEFPDVSWLGRAQIGGGHVPDDYEWRSNPKEHQDELMGEWPEGSMVRH